MFEMMVPAVDPAVLNSDELLDAMAAAQETINALTARQLACAAEFATRQPAPEQPDAPGGESARWGGVSEFASADIAVTLNLSRRAADRLLDTALTLHRLPATAAAMAAGQLDLTRARLICAETAHLDDPDAARVEQQVIQRAPEQVWGELRRALRRAAQQAAPAADIQRRESITEERRTWVEHDGDGRSRFTAEGPTHDVLRLAAAVDAVARTQPPEPGMLCQRRFDTLTAIADTILDDPRLPQTRFGPPGIVLLADLGALARLRGQQAGPGDDDVSAAHHRHGPAHRPVQLAGDGPIPDSLAVELLEAEHTTVVTFDTSTRWPCDHTLGYAVPDRLARYLTGLHPRCVFPGCGVPAHRCDWDHAIPAPQGSPCACNLTPLCRYHQRLKTHSGWWLTLHSDHKVTWTSPTGRTYTVLPDVDVGTPGQHGEANAHNGSSAERGAAA